MAKSNAKKAREEADRAKNKTEHWLIIENPWFRHYRKGLAELATRDLQDIAWWLSACLSCHLNNISTLLHLKNRSFIIARIDLSYDLSQLQSKLGQYAWKDFLSQFPRSINVADEEKLSTKLFEFDYVRIGDPAEKFRWLEYFPSQKLPPPSQGEMPFHRSPNFRNIWCDSPNSEEARLWFIRILPTTEMRSQELAGEERHSPGTPAAHNREIHANQRLNEHGTHRNNQLPESRDASQSQSPRYRHESERTDPRTPSVQPGSSFVDRDASIHLQSHPPTYDRRVDSRTPSVQPGLSSVNRDISIRLQSHPPAYHPLSRGSQTVQLGTAAPGSSNAISLPDQSFSPYASIISGQRGPINQLKEDIDDKDFDLHYPETKKEEDIKPELPAKKEEETKHELPHEGDKTPKMETSINEHLVKIKNPYGVHWIEGENVPNITRLLDWLQFMADGASEIYVDPSNHTHIYTQLRSHVDLNDGVLGRHFWWRILKACPKDRAENISVIMPSSVDDIQGLLRMEAPEATEDYTEFAVPYPLPEPYIRELEDIDEVKPKLEIKNELNDGGPSVASIKRRLEENAERVEKRVKLEVD
ncbi:hypothetical protein M422DRAFT_23920 [Sphaerobolus stellatus SS14]|nr:hypothetical protein M422DRAFT_23920 [Sphaerobolus stellatus SS14]